MNGVILLRSPNLHGTLLCLLKRCDAESYQVIEGREKEGGRGRGKKTREGGREGGREGERGGAGRKGGKVLTIGEKDEERENRV